MTHHTTGKSPKQRVLILGGGFGGVYAALKATVAFFKNDGLFFGQSQAFLGFLNELAEQADEARRESD